MEIVYGYRFKQFRIQQIYVRFVTRNISISRTLFIIHYSFAYKLP